MDNKLKKRISVILQRFISNKKTLLIVFLGILGMLLIVFSEFTENDDIIKAEMSSEGIYFDEDKQREALERLISEISGAGRVKVMITYECSNESIYARNSSQNSEENSRKDSDEYIIIDSGSEESGLLIKENYPKVLGVAVVCDGGNNPTVKNEITTMIKAVFNISSNNISILEMQKQED